MKTRRHRVDKAYGQLRQRIASMGVGVPLPPISLLMRELASSQLTIERAYNLLETEGLIDRRPRKGVFVADPTMVGEFAVVFPNQWLTAEASPFGRMCASSIIQTMHAENARWEVKLHTGKTGRCYANVGAFSHDLGLLSSKRSQRLRGVFALCHLEGLADQLEQDQIAVVKINYPSHYSVCADYSRLARQAVKHLVNLGCRKIGTIGAKYDDQQSLLWDQEAHFLAASKEAGLDTRDAWIGIHHGDISERHGYEQFLKVWQQPDRPDALVVTDDILCRGVLRGIAMEQVEMPGQLRLITMANRHVDLPWHQPVTRVEFDAEALAQVAVKMMIQRIKGEKIASTHILLPGELVQGCTT